MVLPTKVGLGALTEIDGVAVNVEVVDTPFAVNVTATAGESTTVIVHAVRFPATVVLHKYDQLTTDPPGGTPTITTVTSEPNPVPDAVSVAGNVPEPGVNDQAGVAVNVESVGTVLVPSYAVNVSATSGEAETVIVQLKLPVPRETHVPLEKIVSPDTDANVIAWFATNPVPVIVSVWGSVPPDGVNDHDGSTWKVAYAE